MYWIAGLAVLIIAWCIWRTSRLNNDPVQNEISALILAMVLEGFSGQSHKDLIMKSSSLSLRAGRTKLSTRLPHALSMVRSQLTPTEYDMAREIVKDASLSAGRLGD